MKLAVFDFDSTLLEGESINIVLDTILDSESDKATLENIRAKAMCGEIDLENSLKQRIAYFKGLKLNSLNSICMTMPWTQGAKETIIQLKKNGYATLCLSGGFRTATRRVIKELDVDAYCCNTLAHKKRVLTGLVSGELLHHHSKGKMLKNIQRELNISPSDTLVVGDGANDISMFKQADTCIAFNAQDALKEHATCIIESKNLRDILSALR